MPTVPVEFLRQSSGNRITVVLSDGVEPVQSLWAPMEVVGLTHAIDALRLREDPTPARNIGRWSVGRDAPHLIPGLPDLARQRLVEHVVWTALGPKYAGENGRMPSVDEVVSHLRSLQGQEAAAAETYERRAPPQIDTALRRKIVEDLG